MAATSENAFRIADILRTVSAALEIPVVVVLILFLLLTVLLVGWLISEFLTEHRYLKVKLPAFMEELRTTENPVGSIRMSGLLKSQKAILVELTQHPGFSDETREALAVRLLEEEQERYDRIVRKSDLLAKLAPMFGLLGTLIPLGPGIIALGQGDTYTLSTSLLTAFDTTIAGLVAAAVALVVSGIRKGWYRNYMSMLETLAETLLDRLKEGNGTPAVARAKEDLK